MSLNPRIYSGENRDGTKGFYISFYHPRRGDHIWLGADALNPVHSNFGCATGISKFREPLLFPTKEQAEKENQEVFLPYLADHKPSWMEYVRVT